MAQETTGDYIAQGGESIFNNIFLIVIGLIFLIIVWVVITYNKFIQRRLRVEGAWADIDVQLKRRYDLIPNLIETVKGYAKHEAGTLQKVVEMRAEAQKMSVDIKNVTPEQMTAFMGMQDDISGGIGKIFALSENYPDLKASENFVELQREITDTEDKIQAARRFFNNMVGDYKTLMEMFPSNIIGKMFNFTDKEFFEIPENSEERENVKVSF